VETPGRQTDKRSLSTYLSAVQIKALASNFQFQNLYLIVPLLLNRCIPDVSFIQTWFNPTQDLGRKAVTGVKRRIHRTSAVS
jgi:hypothetical protein